MFKDVWCSRMFGDNDYNGIVNIIIDWETNSNDLIGRPGVMTLLGNQE